MLLQSFSGHVQRKVIRVNLAKQSPLNLNTGDFQTRRAGTHHTVIFQPAITHHSLDEVQVLGHHVVEVIGDEHSSDEQLGNKILK